jgi:hypothetical protein
MYPKTPHGDVVIDAPVGYGAVRLSATLTLAFPKEALQYRAVRHHTRESA